MAKVSRRAKKTVKGTSRKGAGPQKRRHPSLERADKTAVEWSVNW